MKLNSEDVENEDREQVFTITTRFKEDYEILLKVSQLDFDLVSGGHDGVHAYGVE